MRAVHSPGPAPTPKPQALPPKIQSRAGEQGGGGGGGQKKQLLGQGRADSGGKLFALLYVTFTPFAFNEVGLFYAHFIIQFDFPVSSERHRRGAHTARLQPQSSAELQDLWVHCRVRLQELSSGISPGQHQQLQMSWGWQLPAPCASTSWSSTSAQGWPLRSQGCSVPGASAGADGPSPLKPFGQRWEKEHFSVCLKTPVL